MGNSHVRDLIRKRSRRMLSAVLSWFELHCGLDTLRTAFLCLPWIRAVHLPQQHGAPLGSPALQGGVGALSELQDAAALKI